MKRRCRARVSRPSWANSDWPRGFLNLSRESGELLPSSRIHLEGSMKGQHSRRLEFNEEGDPNYYETGYPSSYLHDKFINKHQRCTDERD